MEGGEGGLKGYMERTLEETEELTGEGNPGSWIPFLWARSRASRNVVM
jgi:hypothetical protein